MRVWSRVALVVIVLLTLSSAAVADHLQGDCPLTLVGSVPGTESTEIGDSPHGVFRQNGTVFVLRGQDITTFTVNDAGELTFVRRDTVSLMASRDARASGVLNNGYLYLSSEAGLEVFDLRNVRAGGNEPLFVTRIPGRHYRRLAASGNTLAGLFPSTDLPCHPTGTSFCFNFIDIINIDNPASPAFVGRITSFNTGIRGFNDIAFNNGILFATGEGGTNGYTVGDQSNPRAITAVTGRGTFLVSNGTNLLGVGNEGSIEMFNVGIAGGTSRFAIYNIPPGERINHANPIMFHPQAFIDDQNGRLITLIDEKDPHTLQPARTFAIDVFDFTVPMYEGSYERGYENISYITPDEVKYNPTVVGTQVLVVGDLSGLQAYGSCGIAAGKIELDGVYGLQCAGAELRGWVTGTQRINNVEVFIDGTSLGFASLDGALRTDVPSRTPVQPWRIRVNLDSTARGNHTIRAVATDANGIRRQFASRSLFFSGPGSNCTNRRRASGR